MGCDGIFWHAPSLLTFLLHLLRTAIPRVTASFRSLGYTQRHWFTQPRTSTTRAFIMANTLIKLVAVAALGAAVSMPALARGDLNNALGGALGGVAGAALGGAVGGSTGAVIGGAVGGGAG
ncbi:hypothetical protein QZM87_22865, partial [Burkholderia gladioli]|nr:hypothetical protein [Burkholderia gladioli]